MGSTKGSKNFYFGTLAALLSVVAMNAHAQEMPRAELINEPPEHVFVPVGFDNNDNTQIVMSGEFLSACYKLAPAKFSVDVEGKRIFLRNQAFYYASSWCLRLPVPYTQTVDLGALPRGEYQVFVEGRDGKMSSRAHLSVSIVKTPNSLYGTDEHLYAIAEDLKLERDAQGKPTLFRLSGQLTSTCMRIRTVSVLHEQTDTIEILPIVEQRGTNCQRMLRPFSVGLDIPAGLKDHTLVHVRSLNGQSVNRVYEF